MVLVVPETPVKYPWTIVTTSVSFTSPADKDSLMSRDTNLMMSRSGGITPTGLTPQARDSLLRTDLSWEKTMMSFSGRKRETSKAARPVLVTTIGLELRVLDSLLALAAIA